MSGLNPTPLASLCDDRGRPYFLWDVDMTAEDLREVLRTGTREERAYLAGKIMRQAKPDDVFTFLALHEIRDLWQDLAPYLGRSREFWGWILGVWEGRRDG